MGRLKLTIILSVVRRKIRFFCTAEGAYPVFRNISKCCSGGYTVFGIPIFRIINVTTYIANIFHFNYLRMLIASITIIKIISLETRKIFKDQSGLPESVYVAVLSCTYS